MDQGDSFEHTWSEKITRTLAYLLVIKCLQMTLIYVKECLGGEILAVLVFSLWEGVNQLGCSFQALMLAQSTILFSCNSQ